MKDTNTNPLYYLYGLAVKNAMKDKHYSRSIDAADVRDAKEGDPFKCVKALHLKRCENLKHGEVIVLRSRVLLKFKGDTFWTRYTDGARIQRRFDTGIKRYHYDGWFTLKAPPTEKQKREARSRPRAARK